MKRLLGQPRLTLGLTFGLTAGDDEDCELVTIKRVTKTQVFLESEGSFFGWKARDLVEGAIAAAIELQSPRMPH